MTGGDILQGGIGSPEGDLPVTVITMNPTINAIVSQKYANGTCIHYT